MCLVSLLFDTTSTRLPEWGSLGFLKPLLAGITVMILSFRTDRPGQTVQTQIRLLLEEQSHQGLSSGSTLFAITDASLCAYSSESHLVKILGWLQQIFWVSEHLGFLWHFIAMVNVWKIWTTSFAGLTEFVQNEIPTTGWKNYAFSP